MQAKEIEDKRQLVAENLQALYDRLKAISPKAGYNEFMDWLHTDPGEEQAKAMELWVDTTNPTASEKTRQVLLGSSSVPDEVQWLLDAHRDRVVSSDPSAYWDSKTKSFKPPAISSEEKEALAERVRLYEISHSQTKAYEALCSQVALINAANLHHANLTPSRLHGIMPHVIAFVEYEEVRIAPAGKGHHYRPIADHFFDKGEPAYILDEDAAV